MEENRKKGILDDVGIRAKSTDAYSFETFPGSAWNSLKIIWNDNFSRIIIISFISLLFFGPGIAWVIYCTSLAGNLGAVLPYNLFDFIGYVSPTFATEGLKTADIIGNMKYYENAMFEFSILIPLVAVGCVGCGGLAYVSRIFAHRDTDSNMFKGFFVGVAKTFLPALISGIVLGAAVFFTVFCCFVFDAYSLPVVGKVFALIGAGLILAFALVFTMYSVSLASTYKMSLPDNFKDSLKLTVGNIGGNLAFIAVCLGIVGLMILGKYVFTSFYTMLWTLMFMIGTFFIVSLFVCISHSAFDKYINSETGNRAMAVIKEKEMAARERNRQERLERKASGEPAKKKQEPAKFVNPKKKKKGEGQEGGYTEKELKQIEEDRKAVKNESEKTDDGFDASMYEDDDKK